MKPRMNNGKLWMRLTSRASGSGREKPDLDYGPGTLEVEGPAGGVRPWLVLVAGTAVALLTYQIGLLLVSFYVDSVGFLENRGWLDVGPDHYVRFGRLVGTWGMPALYLALTVAAAMWVGRRVGPAAPLHGVLIGAVSVAVSQGIGLFFGPPLIRELIVYPVLALGGGLLGGFRGWAVRAGEEALYETSRAVGAARNPREIAAAVGANLTGSEVNGVSLWERLRPEEEPGTFSLAGFWSPTGKQNWSPDSRLDPDRMPFLPGLEDRVPRRIRTGELPDAGRSLWKKSGTRTLLVVPLSSPTGDYIQGLLVISSRKSRGFSRAAARSYLTVGGQIALALENLRLVEQGRRAGRQAGMLRERQRLAREIHDTLAQGFTSIVMNLEAAEGALPEAPDHPRTRWHLNQARLTARESLSEARRLVWALRPEALENASLPEALTQLADRWSANAGVEAVSNVIGTPRPMSAGIEVTLLRVAQEALANVLKHAKAKKTVLTLSYVDDLVTLDVLDDGIGFDVAVAAGNGDGFGLKTMKERVEQSGGRLTIESSTGEGVTLVAKIPAETFGGQVGPESLSEAP